MKTWILPVVALAVAGAWVASKQVAIVRIERETEVLRERIARATREGGGAAGAKRTDKDQEPGKGSAEKFDWKAIGESMASMNQGRTPDMRAMLKLQEKLMAMDATELEAALDEIEALGLADDVRMGLEQMIVSLLAEKEPRLVVERFFPRMNQPGGGMQWQLARAFQKWIENDPTTARAWFDERIGAGDFDSKSLDGKSQSRLQFEAALVSSLLASDPEAAAARLEALPEDQRGELFQQGMFMNLKPGTERAFAELVRENVPEEQRMQTFAQATGMMVHQGGYERVSEFLDGMEATPEERRAIAAQAAQSKLQVAGQVGKVDRAVVDEMRSWVAGESPQAVDSITGEALGSSWNGDFGGRVKLIEELHAEGGGDALLIGFLNSPQTLRHKDEARRLAAMIVDEERRAAVLEAVESGQPAEGIQATEVLVSPGG